jgi:hypothetical protein
MMFFSMLLRVNVGQINCIKGKKPLKIIRLRGVSCTQTRDRTGMEVNPLVFETSASTNSAIWANSGCKSTIFFGICKEVEGILFVLQLLTDGNWLDRFFGLLLLHLKLK